MLVILQSELISADSYEGGGRGAFLSSSWSSRVTHTINSHSCVELLISDENSLMKIAPYSHTPLNQVWPRTEQHMAHCMCARVFLSLSLHVLVSSSCHLKDCACVYLPQWSKWISFIHYSAFKPCPSNILVRVCSKSLHCKNDFLIQHYCLSVQISKPFSNQDTFTWEAKWLNILSLVLKK